MYENKAEQSMGRAMTRVFLWVLAGALLAAYAGFVYVSWYFQPLRGAVLLVSNERGAVYLKREAAGWDRDRMAISANPDPCTPINSDKDYVFHSTDPQFGLTYKADGQDLLVYTSSTTPAAPRDPSSIGRKILRRDRSSIPPSPEDPAFEAEGYKLAIVDVAGRRCSSYFHHFFNLPVELWLAAQE
jgi:hypothetical protein